jgi:hypothetical protein
VEQAFRPVGKVSKKLALASGYRIEVEKKDLAKVFRQTGAQFSRPESKLNRKFYLDGESSSLTSAAKAVL